MAHEKLLVTTPQGIAGQLSKEDGNFLFGYTTALNTAAVSIGMPVRASHYKSSALHPIFQMNLPEGFMLEELKNRLSKTMKLDPMLLLAISGGATAVGRLQVESDTWPSPEKQSRGESLSEILSWSGTENLFTELVNRYILRAGISGVQPKVLVPETTENTNDTGSSSTKATVITQDLIVKSGRDEYPGLAANEFLCMSIAKEAGLSVPEFFLSNDQNLFVMRRFDRGSQGEVFGFEDMAVLMGRNTEQKYQGSYAEIAKAIRLFATPSMVRTSLDELFDSVALTCILGNGDAHLKNFGLLYGDPTTLDCRLAPAYDIVNTTAYIAEDSLALDLGGSKSIFASRQHLLSFATICGVSNPRDRIENLLCAVETVLARELEITESVPHVTKAIQHGFDLFSRSFSFLSPLAQLTDSAEIPIG